MRDKVKRFISILMTALMLVNLLPVGALAEGFTISNSVQSIWWEPDTGTYNIYVYVMIEGEKSNFVENKSGWFTLGKISNVENMPNPKKLSIGVQTNKVSYSATALINSGKFSHNHNTGVPIGEVNWYRGHEECGFVVADGADDYPEATGKTWHLNGYIDASKVSVAYTIKYIDANTNQEIAAPVVKYGKPGEYVGVNKNEDVDPKKIEGYNLKNYDRNREKLLIGYSPVFYVRYTKSNKTVPVRYEYQIGEDVTEITTQNVGIFTGDKLSNVSVSNEILKGYKVEGWYKVNDSGETSLNEKNATLTAKKAKTYLNSSNNGYYTLYQATTFRAKLVPKADLSYTVNYIDKDTGKAIINAKTVENQTFGAVIESEKEKIEIDGYNYDSVDKEMLTIGLGCQHGAEVCHRQGILNLGPNVEKFAFGILKNANVLLGVGIIENAYDQTAMVRVMTKEEIPKMEPELLKIAKSRMACLKLPQVDVLIVDRIGKDISGEGMDPNIAGRWIVPTIQGGIQASRIGILDITDKTLGNVVGLGMADTCSKRVVERMSRENTYPNSLTSTVTCLCKIPMYFDTQKETIQATIKMTPGKAPEEITMIRIRDTLAMDTIWVSENLLPTIRGMRDMEILGLPEEIAFDENGDLLTSV